MSLFPRLGTHWPFRYSLLVKMSIGIASSLMLRTKFRGNQPADSGEEDFYRVFIIYGHGCNHWPCDQHHINKFLFPCT